MTYGPQPEPPRQPQHPEGFSGPPPAWPPQPPQPQPGGSGGPSPAWPPQAKGFFGVLFDFNFNHFATPAVIKFLYVIGFIGIILGYLWSLVIVAYAPAGYNVVLSILTLLFGAVFAIAELAFWRVLLEFFLSVARMSDGIHRGGFPGSR